MHSTPQVQLELSLLHTSNFLEFGVIPSRRIADVKPCVSLGTAKEIVAGRSSPPRRGSDAVLFVLSSIALPAAPTLPWVILFRPGASLPRLAQPPARPPAIAPPPLPHEPLRPRRTPCRHTQTPVRTWTRPPVPPTVAHIACCAPSPEAPIRTAHLVPCIPPIPEVAARNGPPGHLAASTATKIHRTATRVRPRPTSACTPLPDSRAWDRAARRRMYAALRA